MNYPQLEKAKKAFEEIQSLDAEIIRIERMAEFVANEAGSIEITLKGIGIKPTEYVNPDAEETWQSLLQRSMSSMVFNIGQVQAHRGKEQPTHEIKIEPTPKLILQILNVVLQDKLSRRETVLR